MRRVGRIGVCAVALMLPLGAPVSAQTTLPIISTRQFVAGSAKVTVTGSFSIEQDVPINTQASFGDGEKTWLQFGVSGSAEPNALITYGDNEVGITVARGKLLATGGIIIGEKSECTGKVEVTAKLISARYTCRDVTSYDPATSKLGKVNFDVTFTAKS
jgi:hypothetical protein